MTSPRSCQETTGVPLRVHTAGGSDAARGSDARDPAGRRSLGAMNTATPRLSARGLVKRFGPTPRSPGSTSTSPTGSRSPSWARPAPASPRCCTASRASCCPTPARSRSTAGRSARLSDRERSLLRRRHYGFVFQFGQLLSELPAIENVALPAMLLGTPRREATDLAGRWLGSLGLAGMEGRRPGELSGGQAQRVAVARALITGPAVVFADEPTGALDQATGHDVMQILTRDDEGRGGVARRRDARRAGGRLVRPPHRGPRRSGPPPGDRPMNAVLALAPRFQRAGGRDARVTTTLAITAFAVTTGLTLSVVGGLLGFTARAGCRCPEGQGDDAGVYVILAWIAVVLLVVPLLTLAGAAARLGVARRDARLATLRLLGATPARGGRPDRRRDRLAGPRRGGPRHRALPRPAAAVRAAAVPGDHVHRRRAVGRLAGAAPRAGRACPLLAAGSGAVSLRRVTVSPLGVARRETPKKMTWLRAVVAVVGIGVFMVISAAAGSLGAAAAAALIGAMAVGFATLNAVGAVGARARRQGALRRARTPARLLAARRLLDDPKAAWRVVGGLGLAGFVAGALAVLPAITAVDMSDDPQGAMLMDDLVTGAMVTLVVAFLLAAVSAGIAQAASVLDRRREIALQNLAGTPVELHDAVRRRTVLVPLVFVAVGSALTALVMFFPLLGSAAVSSAEGPLMLAAFLTAGCALVFAATETSRPLLRSVLAETVVRAD